MRVLVVSEPGKDGVFRHVVDLVAGYLEAGCKVALAYSSIRSCPELFEFVAGLRAEGVCCVDLKISNNPTARDAIALLQFVRLRRQFAPDVVHSHSSKAGLLARLLWILGDSMPIIYTPHAYYAMNQRGQIALNPFWFAEALLGQVGITFNVGVEEARFRAQVLGLRTMTRCIFRNWADFAVIHPAPATGAAPTFGTVARFAIQKNPVPLYRALNGWLAGQIDATWVHVGTGDLLDQVKVGFPERMRVVPRFESAPEFYASLDVFVLTSKFEGCPLCVLEALAANLPLVLSRAPGLIEFAQYGLNAIFWCDGDDPASITAALCEAYAFVRSGALCNHRELGERFFSRATTLRHLIDVVRSIAFPPCQIV